MDIIFRILDRNVPDLRMHLSLLQTSTAEMAEATAKHRLQKRKDGSPYIIHPLAVAEIVAEIGLDTDAILGALLHDCIESLRCPR